MDHTYTQQGRQALGAHFQLESDKNISKRVKSRP